MNNPIEAVCVINQNNINGTIIFKEDLKNKNVIITINLSGLTPGLHGFHVHEYGDLREGCGSLCGHYNPKNKKHGGPNDKERHVGDLGNIKANANGVCKMKFTDKVIKLRGKYSIIGRSIVIHEDEDDLGKGGHSDSLTTGHAGKRIACSIIGYSRNNKL
jgi:Cu-Zn family superoxide dismutase